MGGARIQVQNSRVHRLLSKNHSFLLFPIVITHCSTPRLTPQNRIMSLEEPDPGSSQHSYLGLLIGRRSEGTFERHSTSSNRSGQVEDPSSKPGSPISRGSSTGKEGESASPRWEAGPEKATTKQRRPRDIDIKPLGGGLINGERASPVISPSHMTSSPGSSSSLSCEEGVGDRNSPLWKTALQAEEYARRDGHELPVSEILAEILHPFPDEAHDNPSRHHLDRRQVDDRAQSGQCIEGMSTTGSFSQT